MPHRQGGKRSKRGRRGTPATQPSPQPNPLPSASVALPPPPPAGLASPHDGRGARWAAESCSLVVDIHQLGGGRGRGSGSRQHEGRSGGGYGGGGGAGRGSSGGSGGSGCGDSEGECMKTVAKDLDHLDTFSQPSLRDYLLPPGPCGSLQLPPSTYSPLSAATLTDPTGAASPANSAPDKTELSHLNSLNKLRRSIHTLLGQFIQTFPHPGYAQGMHLMAAVLVRAEPTVPPPAVQNEIAASLGATSTTPTTFKRNDREGHGGQGGHDGHDGGQYGVQSGQNGQNGQGGWKWQKGAEGQGWRDWHDEGQAGQEGGGRGELALCLFATLIERILPRDYYNPPPNSSNGMLVDVKVVAATVHTSPLFRRLRGANGTALGSMGVPMCDAVALVALRLLQVGWCEGCEG